MQTTQCTGEETETFYCSLNNTKAQCKTQEVNIVMANLNAKVSKEGDGEIVSKSELRTRNKRGEKWVQWYTANDQFVTNTLFQEHPRSIWTLRSPGRETENQNRLYSYQ